MISRVGLLHYYKQLRQAARRVKGEAVRRAPQVFLVVNPTTLAALPAAAAMLGVVGAGKVFMVGSCRTMSLLAEKEIAEQRARDEILGQLRSEEEALKRTINAFVARLLDNLQAEMGISVTDYQMDQHEVSHAFEDWIKETDISQINSPAARERLKALLAEKIGIRPEETTLLHKVDGALDPEFMRGLNDQIKKADAAIKEKKAAKEKEERDKVHGHDDSAGGVGDGAQPAGGRSGSNA